MLFKIRYANQLVGFFIVLSLVSLIFVIIMLGQSQRWFAKDYTFYTVLPSAGGLSKNMPVLYKGFTIGNVKDFYLVRDENHMEEDNVEVVFSIHEEHSDRVKLGSMVEMMISPVGLGNQFLFHSGGGEPLAPGSFVPVVGSDKAKALIRDGIAVEPQHDDSISVILNRAKTLMELLNEAFGEGGNDATEIGQIVGNIKEILAEAKELAGMVKEAFGEERSDATEIGQIVGSMQETLASAKTLSGMLTDAMGEGSDATKIGTIVGYADSALANLGTITGPEGEVYVNLVESLKSLSSTLDSLDKTAAFIPGQLPQFMGIIMDLRTTLKTAEDVLVALTNNPLLRGGIPEKPQTQDGGISPWTIPF